MDIGSYCKAAMLCFAAAGLSSKQRAYKTCSSKPPYSAERKSHNIISAHIYPPGRSLG